MDLLEYQGKQLFAKHGIAVPSGEVADNVDDAVAAAERIGYPVAIKAQVLIGGRGKAGGVKIAKDVDEARQYATDIIGMDITGPHGEGPYRVDSVWVEGGSDIAEEYYASVILDRGEKKLLTMVSAKGGMDIEAVAAANPDDLTKVHIDPTKPFDAAAARSIVGSAGLAEDALDQAADVLSKLAEVAREEDATLIEVNPLIVTADRDVVALDAKVTIDGNSLFRHEDLAEIADTVDDPLEQMAKEKGPHLRQTRRQRGDPGQRRRALHVDARRRRPGGRRAGQLPRRGRRLESRRDRERAGSHHQRRPR